MCPSVSFILALPALFAGSAAAPIKGIDRQTVQDEYNFIICGGGTAGLVLANRLTESKKQRVLDLEAGPDPNVVAAYKPPGGNQFLGGTAIDSGIYTAPQTHLNNRSLLYHRGRCLGGSSVTNGLFYGRGSASVYNHWARLGNPGWAWEDVRRLFIKGTHFNPPDKSKGFDMTYKTWDPSAYGDGPLEISFQGYVPESGVGFINASSGALKIPIVHDYNTGNSTGVKQGTGTLDAGIMRSSSYDSYLKQAVGRPNLDVLFYAPVQQILIDTSGEAPAATGVYFMDNPTGLVHGVKARKEVILSMGAFHSPQLLMISGIGPSAQLEEFKIDPIVINENVGQHLNDHSVFSIMATVQPEFSTSGMAADYQSIRLAQDEFYNNLTGQYTAPSGITNAFQKLSESELESIGAGAVVTAGLANQSHIEYLYESIWYPGGPTPMIALSRGNVTLRSRSMSELPLVNPNYYEHRADRAVAIQSFGYLRQILAHPDFSRFTVGPNHGEVSPGTAISDDDEDAIFEYVKSNTIPNWHAAGTNQMLPLEDGGVVDARLRVYGIKSLRVVDCSIIPVLPDVNIVGPVYMIAEKGAEMIKEDWNDI